MKIDINEQENTASQKQIDLAAETLAKIFIQQVLSRKNPEVNKQIENRYGKSTN